jgi:uncharacterized protein (TIGR03435 family)
MAKNDSKLRQHETSCTPRDFTKPFPPLAPGEKPLDVTKEPPPITPGEKRTCQTLAIGGVPTGHATADGSTLDLLANGLYGMATDRPVLNKTGMTGVYSFHLEYSRPAWYQEDGTFVPAAWPMGGPPAEGIPDPLPSINAALDDVLGLKLVPAKGPGLFIVVDSIERPTEN